MVLLIDILAPGQDKGTRKLSCACVATYVRKRVRRQNESREKGPGVSLHVICWAASALFRSDTDRGKSIKVIINNKELAFFTTSSISPSTLYFLHKVVLTVVSVFQEILNYHIHSRTLSLVANMW